MYSVRSILPASAMLLATFCGFAQADEIIPLDDFRSKAIFDSATARPELWSAVAHIFESYETQRTQAYCGVASTVIVLNSLGVPGENYVDDWYPYLVINQRTIFNKSFLSVKAPNKINMEGLTLDQLGAAIATNKYVHAATHHATPEMGFDNFKKIIIGALTNPNARVIINYLRGKLNQAGAGHHSPLGAYDPKTDRVLVMDTARYKTGNTEGGLKDGSGHPVWVTLADLWAAVNTEDQIDDDTKAYRGFIVVTKKTEAEVQAEKMREALKVIQQIENTEDKE